MPCYKPFKAWQPLAGGAVLFVEAKDCRTITLPCGQCIGCRIERQEMWAVRCYAESKMHEKSCFITTTYDEKNFPRHGSLNYRDFQLFLKRLRKARAPDKIRYFVAGEYGEQLQRPHFHALLFGCDFPDREPLNSVRSVNGLHQSGELQRLWGKGLCSIGEVTYASARYCAAYVLKQHKKSSEDDAHYKTVNYTTGEIVELEPEFAKMSLKPGLGAAWLEKYWRDIYLSGANAVVINGTRKTVPSYFHSLMRKRDPMFMESFDWSREAKALEQWEEYTPERLEVREEVKRAECNFNRERNL